MEYIVPAIIVLIVIIRTFMGAAKNSQGLRPPAVNPPGNGNRQSTGSSSHGTGSSSHAGNSHQNSLARRSQNSSRQRSGSAKSKSRSTSPPPLPANRAVAYTPPIAADHFSETRLVNEYTRAHSQGKTLKHHTHNYFDPEKDASKSRAGEAKKRRAVKRKQLLKTSNIKQAIIMKQILDRPDF